ncbi:MAG: polysaccharide pyruvyl transferase family protein [Bryobacterales bacterium]|nr:polysaccharide pyruvyl transferase family protein [Bryobacterales bacterium]
MLRVAIWAGGTLDNIGDQLIARITRRELCARLPGIEVQEFCPWNRLNASQSIRFDASGDWPPAMQFDAIVVAGGGVFAGAPFKHPMMQVFCFGPRPLRFAKGVFLAWHGVGLQDGTIPPEQPAWKDHLSALAERLDYCAVRGDDAAGRMGMGRMKPEVVPDPVFALPPLEGQPQGGRRRMKIGVALGDALPRKSFLESMTGPPTAAVCPYFRDTCLSPDSLRNWDFSPQEILRKADFLPSVIQALRAVSSRAEIEFIGFGGIYGDRELARELAAQLPGASLASIEPGEFDDLQRRMQSYDGLVVSRYHAAILALRCGKPFVAADPFWTPWMRTSKLHQLMSRIDAAPFYWTVDGSPGRVETLVDCLERMIGSRESKDRYSRLHAECISSFDRFATALATAAQQ